MNPRSSKKAYIPFEISTQPFNVLASHITWLSDDVVGEQLYRSTIFISKDIYMFFLPESCYVTCLKFVGYTCSFSLIGYLLIFPCLYSHYIPCLPEIKAQFFSGLLNTVDFLSQTYLICFSFVIFDKFYTNLSFLLYIIIYK